MVDSAPAFVRFLAQYVLAGVLVVAEESELGAKLGNLVRAGPLLDEVRLLRLEMKKLLFLPLTIHFHSTLLVEAVGTRNLAVA